MNLSNLLLANRRVLRMVVWALKAGLLIGFVLAVNFSERRTEPFVGYLPAGNHVWAGFILAALAGLFGFFRFRQFKVPAWMPIGMLVALLAGGMLTQEPTLSVSACIAGLIGFVQSPRWNRVRSSANSAWICSILVFLAGFFHERFGDSLRMEGIASQVANLLSGKGFLSNSTLYLADEQSVLKATLSYDKFGGVALVGLIAGGLFLLWGTRPKAFTCLGLLFIATLYAMIVAIFYVAFYGGRGELPFLNDYMFAVLYAPLSIVVALRLNPKAVSKPVTSKAWIVPAIAAIPAMALLCGIPSWTKHPGRVLIDEFHSDWERTNVPFDTETYGSLSVYNYGNFYKELKNHFDTEALFREISDKDLDTASVVILKTPTKPYSKDFCDRIERFVRRGGGLWLVGDHTDAFGMTSILNVMAARFHCEFEKNAWLEPPSKRNLWISDPFTPPFMQQSSQFLFYTGCQMKAPASFLRLAVGNREQFDKADYSAGSFFGKLRYLPSNGGGNALMATAGTVGQGRVAMWSDSTLFSNFSLYLPGKLETGLNTVDWLRQRAPFDSTYFTMAILALTLGISFYFLRTWRTLVVLAFGLAWVPALLNSKVFGTPEMPSGTAYQQADIAFYEPRPSAHLPLYASIDDTAPEYYWSSYVAVQRVGMRPAVVSKPEQLSRFQKAVYIGSEQTTTQDIDTLMKWATGAKQLIILDAGSLLKPVAEHLVDSINKLNGQVQYNLDEGWRDTVGPANLPVDSISISGLLKGNVTPLLKSKQGEILGGAYSFGHGTITLFMTKSMFSDDTIGGVHSVPTKKQRAILEILYRAYQAKLAVPSV